MGAESGDNLQGTLATILGSFLDLVRCDAGSVYTVRTLPSGEKVLKFEAMITRSLGIDGVPDHLRSLRLKIDDATVAGRTAKYRQTIVVNPTVQPDAPTPAVGKVLNYTTRCIFSGPLITPRGELVGVVQLLNKIPEEGQSAQSAPPRFDEKDEQLFSMIVGQSALAIENSLLLDEQERLIEGFVNACVTAIDSRDSATSGHSMRVAQLTVGLAEAVNRTASGLLGGVTFSPLQIRELRFAALLHDIGKIGVKEAVLQKEKKLFPHELEIISMRLKLMRSEMQRQQQLNGVDHRRALASLSRAWWQILDANEPAILSGVTSEAVAALRSLSVIVGPDQVVTALTADEAKKLSVKRGSLTEEERKEIESHAEKTFEILRLIPWSRGLEQVPEIAYRHHETLDGSGYPNAVSATVIPPQTRMMSICDIYDALRAADRPYKPGLPVEMALDIIAAQVKAGKLDEAYFELFLSSRIYEMGFGPLKSGGAAA